MMLILNIAVRLYLVQLVEVKVRRAVQLAEYAVVVLALLVSQTCAEDRGQVEKPVRSCRIVE